jgi:hypothetical protein
MREPITTQTLKVHAIHRKHLAVLIVILIVAMIPRLHDGLAYERFRYDQATLSTLALDMVYGGEFPLLGIESSAGVPNSPMTVYILALPFAISQNPQVVMVFLAMMNVLGVGVLWLIGHRYWGAWVGAFAGIAYAVSPYAVGYSRGIWAQNYHTPLILLAIALGMLGFLERKRWAQVLCLPVLLAGVQIHFAAWTLIPLYFVFLWWGRRNIAWRSLVLSGILSALVLLPFALGILSALQVGGETGAETTSRFETIAAILRDGVRLRSEPLQYVVDIASGAGSDGGARDARDVFRASTPYPNALGLVFVALTFVGLLAVGVYRPWRRYAIFLWLWVFITPLVFVPAWTGTGVFTHYLVPTVPAVILALGLGANAVVLIIEHWSKQARFAYVVVLALLPLFGYQAFYRIQLQTFINDNYVYTVFSPTSQQTSTPIHYLNNVRDALSPYEDVILLGANPHETNFYVWEPLLYDTARCVRDLQIEGGWMALQPAGEFVAVLASPPDDYTMPAMYVTDNPQVVPLRPDEAPYTLYAHESAPEWTGVPLNDISPQKFANGVMLTGYQLVDDLMILRWRLPENTDGVQYSYFAHFLDNEGQRIGQRDTAFYAPQFWCEGDTLTTWVTIALPDATATLRVGMYILEADGGTQEIPIVNDDGAIITFFVDVSLE